MTAWCAFLISEKIDGKHITVEKKLRFDKHHLARFFEEKSLQSRHWANIWEKSNAKPG